VFVAQTRSDVERPSYEMQGPPGLWSPRRGAFHLVAGRFSARRGSRRIAKSGGHGLDLAIQAEQGE